MGYVKRSREAKMTKEVNPPIANAIEETFRGNNNTVVFEFETRGEAKVMIFLHKTFRIENETRTIEEAFALERNK
jgi:hypothetical protein